MTNHTLTPEERDFSTATRATPPFVRWVRKFLLKRPLVFVAALILTLIALTATFAPYVAPYDPNEMNVVNRLQGISAQHPFGTDDFGRDVLSRIVFGARLSILVGFLVVMLSSAVGVVLGLLAGFYRQLDTPIMRLVDALMAFPDILLAIALMAALGPSLLNVVAALGIVYAPRIARIVRASTLVVRERPFVEASIALGSRANRIMLHHVLPNIISPIIVQATFIFAYAILTEAALSFLGVGVPPFIPTWGNMISAGQQYFAQADWLMLFPGLAIVLTVLSLQVIGDGLRDALDPHLHKGL